MGRLDVEMVSRAVVKSRSLAQSLIKDGMVFVNGCNVNKASFGISDEDVIEIRGELPKYVGRGGLKLEKAIDVFGVNLSGLEIGRAHV